MNATIRTAVLSTLRHPKELTSNFFREGFLYLGGMDSGSPQLIPVGGRECPPHCPKTHLAQKNLR